jgi:hypothetical protein
MKSSYIISAVVISVLSASCNKAPGPEPKVVEKIVYVPATPAPTPDTRIQDQQRAQQKALDEKDRMEKSRQTYLANLQASKKQAEADQKERLENARKLQNQAAASNAEKARQDAAAKREYDAKVRETKNNARYGPWHP